MLNTCEVETGSSEGKVSDVVVGDVLLEESHLEAGVAHLDTDFATQTRQESKKKMSVNRPSRGNMI